MDRLQSGPAQAEDDDMASSLCNETVLTIFQGYNWLLFLVVLGPGSSCEHCWQLRMGVQLQRGRATATHLAWLVSSGLQGTADAVHAVGQGHRHRMGGFGNNLS